MKEQAEKVVDKTKSVWDWRGKPSIMANDETLRRSQAATKGWSMRSELPGYLSIFKEKK
jgi:hypothetical protein